MIIMMLIFVLNLGSRNDQQPLMLIPRRGRIPNQGITHYLLLKCLFCIIQVAFWSIAVLLDISHI